jgi:hypothetical protein
MAQLNEWGKMWRSVYLLAAAARRGSWLTHVAHDAVAALHAAH